MPARPRPNREDRTATNTLESLEVIPSGAALGAEIRGIDLARPMPEPVARALRQAWLDHLVLLFRGQDLDADAVAGVGDLFGGAQETGGRRRIVRSGHTIPDHKKTANPRVTVISNLDADGAPVRDNGDLGSLEVTWHTDNSFIEAPPAGTFLYAVEVPTGGGGDTSFSNQYLAWERLPEDLKARVWGRYQKHDWSRNSAGKLRRTAVLPKTPAEVDGPDHPLVRQHPETGRIALYLGRRRTWPSNYILGMPDAESQALLDRLWALATLDDYKWTHVWREGDAVLWDNRCVMHHRTEIDCSQRRVMWRTLVKGGPIIPAWEGAEADEGPEAPSALDAG